MTDMLLEDLRPQFEQWLKTGAPHNKQLPVALDERSRRYRSYLTELAFRAFVAGAGSRAKT